MRGIQRLKSRVFVVAVALVVSAIADARGRRASIDALPFGNWDDEQLYDFSLYPDLENWGIKLADSRVVPIPLPGAPLDNGDPVSDPSEVPPMVLKIGSKIYTHVWINRNGFISLAESDTTPPAIYSPNAVNLSSIGGDIIAAFYSAIHLRPIETPDDTDACSNQPPRRCVVDLTYSQFDARASLDGGDAPDFVLGFRVTWGLFPQFWDDPLDPARAPGVTSQNVGATPNRNTFQISLIDRELTTGRHGDFDLNLNYSGIKWQSANTLVGVRTGPANAPNVLVDFAKFYTSFLDNNPDIAAANVANCSKLDASQNASPSFDKAFALGCNWITIEFRDGVPNLKTYTSDVSGTLTASAGVLHAAVPYAMTLSIANGDFDVATNAIGTIDLPAGATLVSTPASACAQAGAVATCKVSGSLAPHSSVAIPVQISSNLSGRQDFRLRIDADQYDWNTADNTKDTSVTVVDSADLSITGCAAPASVVQGNAVTVTCTVKNNGPQAAASVAIDATVPTSLTFTSGAGCAVAAGVVTCTATTIASGATQDFVATFSTSTVGTANVSATVRSLTFDPQANNTAAANIVVAAPVVVDPPKSGGGGGGGRLSIEALIALLFGAVLTARRRYVLAALPGGNQ